MGLLTLATIPLEYVIGSAVGALAAVSGYLLWAYFKLERENRNLKAIVDGFRVEPTAPSVNVARERLRVVK